VSPWAIASFGHSGSQAPQLMQSSLIVIAIAITPRCSAADIGRHGLYCKSRSHWGSAVSHRIVYRICLRRQLLGAGAGNP
jgi:hypothetical protein